MGLAYLQIGILNLFNALNSFSNEGIRCVVIGINVLAVGLLAWITHLFTDGRYNFLLLGIMAIMTFLSVFNRGD